jgi:hypothetical protein
MVMSSAGLGPEIDCADEDQQQARLLVRISTNPQLSDSNKNLVLGLRFGLGTKTDCLTDRRF